MITGKLRDESIGLNFKQFSQQLLKFVKSYGVAHYAASIERYQYN